MTKIYRRISHGVMCRHDHESVATAAFCQSRGDLARIVRVLSRGQTRLITDGERKEAAKALRGVRQGSYRPAELFED